MEIIPVLTEGASFESTAGLTPLSNGGTAALPAPGIQVNSVTTSVPDGGSRAMLLGLGLGALLLLKSSTRAASAGQLARSRG